MARKPSIFFRFAGILSLFMLAVMSILYAWVVPRPTPRALPGDAPISGQDARWSEARAWVKAHPGTALLPCPWPVDLPRGGRIEVEPVDAPTFWDRGHLVQGVPESVSGGVVRSPEGQPRAWVSWDKEHCRVTRPQTVRVEGRTVDGAGVARPGLDVSGCGQTLTSGPDGTFVLVLGAEALAEATSSDQGPVCTLVGERAVTPVRLSSGGVVQVTIQ
ncbi:MAG: hypothetical protein AB8H79_24250 [Myxococcota bacterium]